MACIQTQEITGMKVLIEGPKVKRLGKCHRVIFHPQEKRCIGILVKRPDFLWMFRRKEVFIAFEALRFEERRIYASDNTSLRGKSAIKKLGVNWDDCVIWEGLTLMDKAGNSFGVVGNISLNEDGSVCSLFADKGDTYRVLLGDVEIPASEILGFKRGMGSVIGDMSGFAAEDENAPLGAILVSDKVLEVKPEGGLAEKAGKTYYHEVKPQVEAVKKKTGDTINKGAYQVGKQIGKTKGMFAAFKEEYDKARHDEE